MVTIDLNSDLGEHPDSNLDEFIMPFLSSCNIACGGHAGTMETVQQSVKLAKKHQVAVGAHPSYPDQANFGRKVLKMPQKHLMKTFRDQVLVVKKACHQLNVPLHHIKPHGALYNEAAKEQAVSALICKVIKEIDPNIKLYGLAHSITESVAKDYKIPFVREGFADRRYESDHSLMSRKRKGAVITKELEVLTQVEEMVLNHRVYANDWILIDAQTLCLHSDTQGSVNLAKKIRQHLERKGVQIAAI